MTSATNCVETISSDLIRGFERVSVVLGLRCPACRGRPLLPFDTSRDEDTITVTCPTCATVVFLAEMIVDEPDEEGDAP
jgi:hypothetical protein